MLAACGREAMQFHRKTASWNPIWSMLPAAPPEEPSLSSFSWFGVPAAPQHVATAISGFCRG